MKLTRQLVYEQSEMSDMTFFKFQHRVDNITDTNLTFADSDSFSLSTLIFYSNDTHDHPNVIIK